MSKSPSFTKLKSLSIHEGFMSAGKPLSDNPSDGSAIAGYEPVIDWTTDNVAGAKVFDVDKTQFTHILYRKGKKKGTRWNDYVDMETDLGQAVKAFSMKNPKSDIMLRNTDCGSMCYLKRVRTKTWQDS